MNPYLTRAGRALLAATVLMIAAGSLTGAWPVLLLGASFAALMVLACYALLPASLVLERRLIKIELSTEGSLGAFATDTPVVLKALVRNRSSVPIHGIVLRPHLGSNLAVHCGAPVGFSIQPWGEIEVPLEVVSRESGRHVCHGFLIHIRDRLGLFEIGEYAPCIFPIVFRPNVALGRSSRSSRALRSKSRDRAGLQLVRQRGFGTELRELRDHQHGDPFRAIAWKATARTGRLMVREYESERVLNTYLCLDISSTMRGGYRHNHGVPSKLEHATRLVTGLAQMSRTGGDRVGLITFDESLHGHIQPRDGKMAFGQIFHHLIGLRHIVDADMTEYTDLEVAELVARYLMVQERLNFRRRSPKTRVKGIGQGTDYWSFSREVVEQDPSDFDVELLERWVEGRLSKETRRYDDPVLSAGVLDYEEVSPLRRFCHLRGIEIPYRVEARLGQKERGLVQALEHIARQTRDSHLVLFVCDLCGVVNTDLIQKGLRLALARRHRIAFLMPFTPRYVSKEGMDDRGEILHELFTLAELEERRNTVHAIESLGVPVVPVGPEDSLDRILAQVSSRIR